MKVQLSFSLLKKVLLAILIVLTSACQIMPRQADDQSFIDHWEIRGKLGARSADEAISGFLNWQQYGQQYKIYLSGALGQGATTIKGNDQRISIVSGSKEVRSRQPEALLHEHFGWRFPISGLLYWVQAQPHPHQPFEATYDDDGVLEVLKQSDWEIEYFRYEYRQGRDLPSYIKMTNDDWTLTLVVKDWLIDG